MNFSGFVPFRRGILEQTMTGALSNHEFIALTVLILLADKSTGRGTINAPTLRTFLPELSYPAAKRILKSLQDKAYIWRLVIPHDKVAYPYWVAGYEPTTGPHKAFRLDISQVIQSNDPKDIRYRRPVPEGEPHPEPHREPEGEPHPVPNYKKDKDKNKKKENPPLLEGVCASACSPNANVVSTVMSAERLTCEPGDAHVVSTECARGDSHGDSVVSREVNDLPLPPGIVRQGDRYYAANGAELEAAWVRHLASSFEQTLRSQAQ